MAVPGEGVLLTLDLLGWIAGRVRAQGVEALVEIGVTAIGRAPGADGNDRHGTVSQDPEGKFRLEVPEGVYDLEAEASGFARGTRGPVTLRSGETVEGARVEALTSSGEEIVEEAMIRFSRGQIELTAADGTLALKQVAAGDYRARAAKGEARSREVRFTVAPGQGAEVRLVLGR